MLGTKGSESSTYTRLSHGFRQLRGLSPARWSFPVAVLSSRRSTVATREGWRKENQEKSAVEKGYQVGARRGRICLSSRQSRTTVGLLPSSPAPRRTSVAVLMLVRRVMFRPRERRWKKVAALVVWRRRSLGLRVSAVHSKKEGTPAPIFKFSNLARKTPNINFFSKQLLEKYQMVPLMHFNFTKAYPGYI